MCNSIKLIILTCFWTVASSCGTAPANEDADNVAIINGDDKKVFFNKLTDILGASSQKDNLNDSIAFLVIPIDASCNSCRDKSIRNVLKNLPKIDDTRIVIITCDGYKTIQSYFQKNSIIMPETNNRIIIDSNNMAFKYDLLFSHPTIYYCYEHKVYKKVVSYPTTIDADLAEYFN